MKSYNTLEIFPIIFYEFQWTEDEIRPLLEEVQYKKEIIKDRTKKNEGQTKDNHCTDYLASVKLLEYEKLIEDIYTTFLPELQCKHIEHWTAIYGEMGYHPAHSHTGPLFSVLSPNMSSVLYLSNIGGTHFFNPSQIGVIDKDFFVPAKVGKIVMFPAQLIHRVIPHGEKNEERFIISSNWRIHETPSGA